MIKWNGNDLCEKGFLINLKKRTERLRDALEVLEQAKLVGVELYDAIEIKDSPYEKYGCTQSHINIAKMQKENNWEYVLYLEDDIGLDVFYNYESLEKKLDYNKIVFSIISDFKEYKPDILWLGTRIEKQLVTKVTNNLIKPKSTIMSHAYIGSLKYAKFVVENLQYDNREHFSNFYPIDFFQTQIIEKCCWHITDSTFTGKENILSNDLNILASVPMIFNQKKCYSDIVCANVDYYDRVRECFNKYVDIKELQIEPYYE